MAQNFDSCPLPATVDISVGALHYMTIIQFEADILYLIVSIHL